MRYIILTSEMSERLENEIFIRGWSLRDFARKSGVSVSAISRYINGEIKTVQASTMYKFAKTLGTSVNWLRFGARQNRKNDLINRKGDTISRSALKEAFKNKGEGVFKLSRVIDLIDNAPTVETLTKEDMSGAYNEGYACGSRESERPNGKIVKDYIPYVDDDGNLRTFERYVCSECRESVPSISKFCLHCGIEFER